MEQKFRIVGVQAKNDHIILELEPENQKHLRPEQIIEPEFSSEDERIGYRIGKSVLAGMMSMEMEMPGPRDMPPGMGMSIRKVSRNLIVPLSKEEYIAIGEPTVNRLVILTIKIEIK